MTFPCTGNAAVEKVFLPSLIPRPFYDPAPLCLPAVSCHGESQHCPGAGPSEDHGPPSPADVTGSTWCPDDRGMCVCQTPKAGSLQVVLPNLVLGVGCVFRFFGGVSLSFFRLNSLRLAWYHVNVWRSLHTNMLGSNVDALHATTSSRETKWCQSCRGKD